MSYRVGGALALIAAVLLAVSVTTHAWWTGHPVVEGHEHATQDISIGLLGGEGCNTGGDGSCKKILLGGGFKTISGIEFGVGMVTLLLGFALAGTALLGRSERARIAKLLLGAGGAATVVAVALAVMGPDMIKAPSDTSVPIGFATIFGMLGGLVSIAAAWACGRPPSVARPKPVAGAAANFPVEPWMAGRAQGMQTALGQAPPMMPVPPTAPQAPPQPSRPIAIPTPPPPPMQQQQQQQQPMQPAPPSGPRFAPDLPYAQTALHAPREMVGPGGKLTGPSGPLVPQTGAHGFPPPPLAMGLGQRPRPPTPAPPRSFDSVIEPPPPAPPRLPLPPLRKPPSPSSAPNSSARTMVPFPARATQPPPLGSSTPPPGTGPTPTPFATTMLHPPPMPAGPPPSLVRAGERPSVDDDDDDMDRETSNHVPPPRLETGVDDPETGPGENTDSQVRSFAENTSPNLLVAAEEATGPALEDSLDIETQAHERVSAPLLETVPIERPSISMIVSTPRPPPIAKPAPASAASPTPSSAALTTLAIPASASAATTLIAPPAASSSASLSAAATIAAPPPTPKLTTDAQVIVPPPDLGPSPAESAASEITGTEEVTHAVDEPEARTSVEQMAYPDGALADEHTADDPAPPKTGSRPPITSTASAALPPPEDLEAAAATAGPSPACPQCDSPMTWVEEHLRFYCKTCKMYF